MTSSHDSTDHSTDHDVLDLLVTDHREATDYVEQIRATTDPQERRDLADRLISELVRHSVAEETLVYPVMREKLPDGDAAVEHDVAEHKELERTMKELEGCDAADPRFLELVGTLDAALADHIRDEEEEQFPRLRQHCSDDTLVTLKGRVEALKKVAPTRPHPSAPNSPLFHALVGPGVGLVDRARDKLTGRAG